MKLRKRDLMLIAGVAGIVAALTKSNAKHKNAYRLAVVVGGLASMASAFA